MSRLLGGSPYHKDLNMWGYTSKKYPYAANILLALLRRLAETQVSESNPVPKRAAVAVKRQGSVVQAVLPAP